MLFVEHWTGVPWDALILQVVEYADVRRLQSSSLSSKQNKLPVTSVIISRVEIMAEIFPV